MPPSLHLHASAVIIGEGAVLVRGEAGSGKTGLCLALLAEARTQGLFARLLCDDRVRLERHGGRIVARAFSDIAGLVERRGLGLTPLAHEGQGVAALVVDCLAEEPPRMPEPEALVCMLLGAALPRLALKRGQGDAAHVLAALALFRDVHPR